MEEPTHGSDRAGPNPRTSSRQRSAVAGSVAAAVWALQEPVDQFLFRCDYSDVAVLGKMVTRGRGWWPAGFSIHLLKGRAQSFPRGHQHRLEECPVARPSPPVAGRGTGPGRGRVPNAHHFLSRARAHTRETEGSPRYPTPSRVMMVLGPGRGVAGPERPPLPIARTRAHARDRGVATVPHPLAGDDGAGAWSGGSRSTATQWFQLDAGRTAWLADRPHDGCGGPDAAFARTRCWPSEPARATA